MGAAGVLPMKFRPPSRLACEQLELALRNLRPNSVLMPIFGLITCAIFYQWLEVPRLATWLAIVLVGGLPLGLVCRLYDPHRAMEGGDWQLRAGAGYLVFALSWAPWDTSCGCRGTTRPISSSSCCSPARWRATPR